ncbi:MAG: triose-phosphate isomerase, partial [Bryobacteraceae bacterium]
MRRRVMAANWKMYKTAQDATDFFEQLKAQPVPSAGKCELVVCPPALAIPAAVAATSGTETAIGGQNVFWEREGAFTGEISP